MTTKKYGVPFYHINKFYIFDQSFNQNKYYIMHIKSIPEPIYDLAKLDPFQNMIPMCNMSK